MLRKVPTPGARNWPSKIIFLFCLQNNIFQLYFLKYACFCSFVHVTSEFNGKNINFFWGPFFKFARGAGETLPIFRKYREHITCSNWTVNTRARHFSDTRLWFHISRTRLFFTPQNDQYRRPCRHWIVHKTTRNVVDENYWWSQELLLTQVFSNKATLIEKQEKKTFLNLLSNVQTKYNADLFKGAHQLTWVYTKSPKIFRYTFICYKSQVVENRFFVVKVRENVYENNHISTMTVATAIKTYMRVLRRLG